MKYLVKLARFVDSSEQRQISNKLRDQGFKVSSDRWAPKRRIIVTGNKLPKGNGVSSVIEVVCEEATKDLSETVELIQKQIQNKGWKEFSLKTNFLNSVPFHGRAIEDRLKKKLKFTKNPSKLVYVEAKEIDYKISVRVGFMEKQESSSEKEMVIIVESPKTPHEVADFIRLSFVFGLELRVVTDGDYRSVHAVQDGKTIAKGYEKARVVVYKNINEAIEGYNGIAFSLWGDSKPKEMTEVARPLALVFGNEERGLKLTTQNKCKKVVRIGEGSSEPLRSSQAAAFALGVLLE